MFFYFTFINLVMEDISFFIIIIIIDIIITLNLIKTHFLLLPSLIPYFFHFKKEQKGLIVGCFRFEEDFGGIILNLNCTRVLCKFDLV